MTDILIKTMQQYSYPLEGERDLDVLIERIGDAKIVMLGEASHGTKEYYIWRSEISKRLIQEKSFSFIAVEGDWPDCYEINRYIKGYKDSGENAEQVLKIFKRWPSWMWANESVRELAEWLHFYNLNVSHKRKIGFYGLDVYSLWESMETIINYLKETDGEALESAYRAYGCFEPYNKEVYSYGHAAAFVDASCQEEVVELLANLIKTNIKKYNDPQEALFNAVQNARVARNAEKYYRTMVRADDLSWNIRDQHMQETLERLLEYHGPEAKAIVWAHNTHIGDARATDMAAEGMVNIGQLARDEFGKDGVVLVGFGSYEGSVIAGSSWGAPMQKMPVPKARRGSWEHILHEIGTEDKLIITKDLDIEEAQKIRVHRAIGVVYDPEFEAGNYVPTDLINRYDAFIYLDQTQALEPLPIGRIKREEVPETYPTGV